MQDNIFSRIAAALALVVAGAGRDNPELDAHLRAIDDKLQNDEAHEAADNSAQSARLDVLEQGIQTIASALPSDTSVTPPAADTGGSGATPPATGSVPTSDTNGGDSVPPASGTSDVPPAATGGASDTGGVVGAGGAADTGSGSAPAGSDVPADMTTSGSDTSGLPGADTGSGSVPPAGGPTS